MIWIIVWTFYDKIPQFHSLRNVFSLFSLPTFTGIFIPSLLPSSEYYTWIYNLTLQLSNLKHSSIIGVSSFRLFFFCHKIIIDSLHVCFFPKFFFCYSNLRYSIFILIAYKMKYMFLICILLFYFLLKRNETLHIMNRFHSLFDGMSCGSCGLGLELAGWTVWCGSCLVCSPCDAALLRPVSSRLILELSMGWTGLFEAPAKLFQFSQWWVELVEFL